MTVYILCNVLGYGNSPKIFTGFFTSKFSALNFLGISLKFAKCSDNFLDVVFQGMSNFIPTIHKDKSNIPPNTMWGINYNPPCALCFFIFLCYYAFTFVALPNSLNTRKITALFSTHHIAISAGYKLKCGICIKLYCNSCFNSVQFLKL